MLGGRFLQGAAESVALHSSDLMRNRCSSLTELKLVLYSTAPSRINARTHIHQRLCFAFEIGGYCAVAEYCEARLALGIDDIHTSAYLRRCINLGYVIVKKMMDAKKAENARKAKQAKLRQAMMPSLIRERQEQLWRDQEAKIAHVARHIHNGA